MDFQFKKEPLEVNHTDISWSTFQNSTIEYAAFTDVNLNNLTIRNASLKGASIVNANITDMKIDYVYVSTALDIYSKYWDYPRKEASRKQYWFGRVKNYIISKLNTY